MNYNKEVVLLELDEVVRQAKSSGILVNATLIREQLDQGFYDDFQFNIHGYPDIVRLVDGHDVQEAIDGSYASHGKEETTIIVRSNKRANLYNQNIRERILFLENELAVGDFMMVVKNNYFWLKPNSEAGFIANGDIIEVLEIFSIKELYTFRFAEVKVQLVDYPNMEPFETVLLLDTITSSSPSLSYDDGNRLYQEVMKTTPKNVLNTKSFWR